MLPVLVYATGCCPSPRCCPALAVVVGVAAVGVVAVGGEDDRLILATDRQQRAVDNQVLAPVGRADNLSGVTVRVSPCGTVTLPDIQ